MKKKLLILCIDDDADIRFALGELFTMQGWSTESAASVAEGLELYRKREPDIVLIDYHMPGINGVEGVRLIRSFSKTVPIIVFTIDEEQAVADRFLEAGATDFALKPIRAPDLISRINLHMRLLEKETQKNSQSAVEKGMSEATMQLICDFLRANPKREVMVDELANETGIAYQTAHRYLQYLTKTGTVEQVNVYGKVGRPKQKYRWK